MAEWLKELKVSVRHKDGEYNIERFPKLEIIFSPEHNTNVGFAQYVNTYYFNGVAEVVSLNVDKEFRSNFICEHFNLKMLIETLFDDLCFNTSPVNFYFVDDTIITGETFYKANSFLRSLLPDNKKSDFGVYLFKKVFVLVDRLSNESKLNYVNTEEDFISYVHIDVSNTRTQGDSCIGCKLENDARRMFKRSATKILADYWTKKMKSLKKVAYDDYDSMSNIEKADSFKRMVMSHILQNLIVKNGSSTDYEKTYKSIVYICMHLLGLDTEVDKSYEEYDDLFKCISGILGVKLFLKVICRPFFSYDNKIRSQVLLFYIRLIQFITTSGLLLDATDNYSDILKDEEQLFHGIKREIEKNDESELLIVQDYLMEGLTDIGSNYLARKQTIEEMYNYVEVKNTFNDKEKKEFWEAYAINIQRLLDESADETKGLRLEYLYLSGKEIEPKNEQEQYNVESPLFLFEAITGKEESNESNIHFYHFCHTVFLQNMGINFDGLERINTSRTNEDRYYLYVWECIRKMDSSVCCLKKDMPYDSELKMFKKLSSIKSEEKKDDSLEEDITTNAWYEEFVDLFKKIISQKYGLKTSGVDIALLTENRVDEQVDIIQRFEIVTSSTGLDVHNSSHKRFDIKDCVSLAVGKNKGNIIDEGYYISDDNTENPYIIIMFDNPKAGVSENAGRTLHWIEKVFLYICINNTERLNEIFFLLRFILRDILTFRNKIMRFLERDFSGDIYARYARTVGENNIITMEKSSSHATSADDLTSLKCFTEKWDNNKYDRLEEIDVLKWLLLRNYTNAQIAKMFNRSFRGKNDLEQGSSEAPPLYVGNEYSDEEEIFSERLKDFSQLGLDYIENKEDKRWGMLKQIAVINYDTVKTAQFICSEDGHYYNTEYFRCILTDIFLSAIKYESIFQDYLKRIDEFMANKTSEEPERGYDIKTCVITISRRITSKEKGADYLVIRNPVNGIAHINVDISELNNQIRKRLRDPLDCADGHLSSVTIKRYIENIQSDNYLKCEFEYLPPEDDSDIYYFETRLPVLKKENLYGKNDLLD